MKHISFILTVLTIFLLIGCSHSDKGTKNSEENMKSDLKEAEILLSWQGDFPVSQLELFPEIQRDLAVGYIGLAETFETIWMVFKPGEDVPEIDFNTFIVIFARNTQYYNRNSIGKVIVTKGIAEVLAMETMSAMPIEDKVAISMVVVSKHGIKGIKTGNGIIVISE